MRRTTSGFVNVRAKLSAKDTVSFPSPWNHLEAGILFGLRLPLPIFRESTILGGVFRRRRGRCLHPQDAWREDQHPGQSGLEGGIPQVARKDLGSPLTGHDAQQRVAPAGPLRGPRVALDVSRNEGHRMTGFTLYGAALGNRSRGRGREILES